MGVTLSRLSSEFWFSSEQNKLPTKCLFETGYCSVAVIINWVSLLLVRSLYPKICRVSSCMRLVEPPSDTGWPLGTIISVIASVKSMAPECSAEK
jgi:hypothetical protein